MPLRTSCHVSCSGCFSSALRYSCSRHSRFFHSVCHSAAARTIDAFVVCSIGRHASRIWARMAAAGTWRRCVSSRVLVPRLFRIGHHGCLLDGEHSRSRTDYDSSGRSCALEPLAGSRNYDCGLLVSFHLHSRYGGCAPWTRPPSGRFELGRTPSAAVHGIW